MIIFDFLHILFNPNTDAQSTHNNTTVCGDVKRMADYIALLTL